VRIVTGVGGKDEKAVWFFFATKNAAKKHCTF